MIPAAAIDRGDVAQYVDSVFLVMIILVITRIVISYVVMFRGSLPYNTPLRATVGFVEGTVDPYLNVFRRFLPTIGMRGMGLDLSPMVGIIVLIILQGIVVALIRG